MATWLQGGWAWAKLSAGALQSLRGFSAGAAGVAGYHGLCNNIGDFKNCSNAGQRFGQGERMLLGL